MRFDRQTSAGVQHPFESLRPVEVSTPPHRFSQDGGLAVDHFTGRTKLEEVLRRDGVKDLLAETARHVARALLELEPVVVRTAE
eukprot:scaffold29843_cov63-Phaeocystis_antarctica.AAC.4